MIASYKLPPGKEARLEAFRRQKESELGRAVSREEAAAMALSEWTPPAEARDGHLQTPPGRIYVNDREGEVVTGAVFSVQVDPLSLVGAKEKIAANINAAMPREIEFTVVAGGSRGARENATIANKHAKTGRNAFFINAKAMKEIRTVIPRLLSRVSSVRRAAEEIIKLAMLVSIGENVKAGRNPDRSPFRRLTQNYAAYKRRRFGAGLPILVATGDMIGGLRARVIRR